MCLVFLVLAGNSFWCFVHMVLIVQYSCAVVSVFGSGGKSISVLHILMYLEYNTIVVLCQFFGPGGKQLLSLRTYLVYNTVVRLCQFFWLWREIVLKMRTRFYKKILLGGLLYNDPIADVCIYKTKHYSFTLYLSILYISLVPHRFTR